MHYDLTPMVCQMFFAYCCFMACAANENLVGEELILQTHLWNNCQYHASADGEKIQEDISLNITHNFRDEDTIFPIEFADVLESLLEHYPKKIQVRMSIPFAPLA